MMDEQLIDEVAQHSVIYNRQKYYMNGSNGSGNIKYETKDGAWQIIAMKLRSDVETCKKRWKYLRERYVSQRKQGDPPVYEHLSRPYLEKMKFLDQHIQPRKSYRSMPNYLTSPHSANSSFNGDFNMDTKSNGSIKSMNIAHYPNPNNHHYNHVQSQDQHAMDNGSGHVKIEADQMFRDFAAAVASQQLHQHQVAAVAAAIADSSQNFQDNFRESSGNPMHGSNMSNNHNAGLPVSSTSSSALKSPLSSSIAAGSGTNGPNGSMAAGTPTPNNTQSSPTSTSCTNPTATGGYGELNTDDLDSSTSLNFNMKKPRVQLNNNIVNGGNMNGNSSSFNNSSSSHNNNNNNNNNTDDSDDDDSDEKSSNLMQPQMLHANENPLAIQRHTNVTSGNTSNQITSNAEFLFQLYQQLPHQQQQQLNASSFSQQQQQPPTLQHQQQQQSHFNKYQMAANSSTPIERSSEQLLGELVTSELLKMNKERRKNVQKRILEILFFDD